MDQMDAMNAVTEIVAMIEHTMTETIARFVWVVAKRGSDLAIKKANSSWGLASNINAG
jgi:hypothetical protein